MTDEDDLAPSSRVKRGPWCIATVGLAAALLCVGAADASDRVALVVGNATYANQALNLRNPANDARDIAGALESLGFESHIVIDASRPSLEAALTGFADSAAEAEIALFFFAGHGVQMGGENHLITSEFSEISREEINRGSVTLSRVRDTFAAIGADLGIIVLDACRDNPLAAGVAATRGLARSQGGSRLLIAYATDPGSYAYDGQGENSVFTGALTKHIATPGLDVRLMFGRVRQDVVATTKGGQLPWVEEAVLGEHFLKPAPAGSFTNVASDVDAWRKAVADGSAEAYARYLEEYPDGLYAPIAEERLARSAEPPAGETSDADFARWTDDREPVLAALSTLGLLPASRNLDSPHDEAVTAALDVYAREVPAGVADIETLVLDATQVTVMLGALTAQRIRTDLKALSAIEITFDMATRARGELAALAQTEADARDELLRADADLAAITGAHGRVLQRLDESRTYYADLVERGATYFRPYLTRSLAGTYDRLRRPEGIQSITIEDAARFVEHARADGVTRPEGSIAWLTDFLPAE